MEEKKKSIVEVRVRGKNLTKWKENRSLFMEKIRENATTTLESILTQQIDPIKNTTVKEEFDQLVSRSLDFVKSKLSTPGVELEKSFAEIQKIYIEIEKSRTEIEQKQLENERNAFKNKITKLRYSLGATKILLAGDEDEESIIFIKEIDQWIKLIEEVNKMIH